jgi:subtilisin family serine protease
VVVVAAAGNAHSEGNPTPYPAAYDGVLGVGAINADGVKEEYSQVGDYVDVVAPGGGIAVAWPDGRYSVQSGTSYATPFVAATAALVRQYRPDLSAGEVARRIVATADPAPGGDRSAAYGGGVVNPYRAVTEEVAVGPPERATPLATLAVDPAAQAAQRRRAENRRDALLLAFGGTGSAVLVLILALVVPRGARRRWRPAEPA